MSSAGPELAPAVLDTSEIGTSSGGPVSSHSGGLVDPSVRFLHREVNELLADLDE
jgi:hypothetical protein